jgi:hypothetical protein
MINIEIKNEKKEDKNITYPCIGVGGDGLLTVLFTAHKKGVVLVRGVGGDETTEEGTGYCFDAWKMSYFTLYDADIEITLKEMK